MWRALMAHLARKEANHLAAQPLESVRYTIDVDYVGDSIRQHRLDVLAPISPRQPLPVYVYFHGGGWTSGDKQALTTYCASQAAAGMVVVNVNYRMATTFQMSHMLQDANAALAWVRENIGEYGGDPDVVVVGGDSAGGQIAALVAAAACRPELAAHYVLEPALDQKALRGVVLHCSAVDFSVNFERGFVLSHNFIRMLLPNRGRGLVLRHAARFLSPIEWLDESFPPVLVTTSERDYFYRANLNFLAALRRHKVRVDALIYDRNRTNTEHTWQQNALFPESQEVYRRLQSFVRNVARRPIAPVV